MNFQHAGWCELRTNLNGGMLFDPPKPFKPGEIHRSPHPLGDRSRLHVPWMASPSPVRELESAGGHPLGETSLSPPWPGQYEESPSPRSVHARARGARADRAGEWGPLNAPPVEQQPPPPPPPPPRALPTEQDRPAQTLEMPPPAEDDLLALYRLCGGDELQLIMVLAKMWSTSPAAIAPTVRGWLQRMPKLEPPAPPPRSAPPTLEFAPSWAAAAMGGDCGAVPPAVKAMVPLGLHKPPPMSAPGGDGTGLAARPGRLGGPGAGLTRQLNLLNARVNSNIRLGPDDHLGPTAECMLRSVPEEGPTKPW